ncbi:MAG: SPOR domain-containing protein [Burkholderiales bacterium]|nr:SPOR domain-containing protein [Burkholderiales bacterium]
MQDSIALIDEERRRGRRRLVGAIVLALFAIIVVPILLYRSPDTSKEPPAIDVVAKEPEATVSPQEPTTQPDEPPVPMNSPSVQVVEPPPAPPENSRPQTPPVIEKPATVEVPPVLPKPVAPKAKEPDGAGPARPAAGATVNRPPESKDPKEATQPTASNKPKETVPADAKKPKVEKAEPPKTVPPKKGAFAVQVNAFSDDKGANALMARLKKNGYPAYVEPSLDSKTVWRVRVGAYEAKADAEKIQKQLLKSGYKKSYVTEAR